MTDEKNKTTNEEKQENKNKGKKEMLEVDKKALERLISRVEQQEKEIKKLTEIADRGRLAHWETTHKEESPKIYRLSVYKGKIILSWKMITNMVWKDSEGKWREKQEIELYFEDGEKEVVPYVEFVNKTEKIPVKLISTTQQGGQTILKVETEDGKKYTIDSTYIN